MNLKIQIAPIPGISVGFELRNYAEWDLKGEGNIVVVDVVLLRFIFFLEKG